MADARASGGVRPLYSNGYKAAVLGLLLAAYTFNFIDRPPGICTCVFVVLVEDHAKILAKATAGGRSSRA